MTDVTPTVYVIDDDTAFLDAVSRFLRASQFQVKTFSAGKEFLNQFTSNIRGCIIADLNMPGMTGLELQAALLRLPHFLPIIFLTGQGDIPTSVQAMRDGTVDFLEKLAPKERIVAAVKRALAHDRREQNARAQQRDLLARFNSLTARELEVLEHVVLGKMNKQIAADLGIAERTVKVHRSSITTKLGAPSTAELTRLTLSAGLFKR